MYSNNTLAILPKPVYGYLFLDPSIVNAERVSSALHDDVAVFFTWTDLFRLEITRKDFTHAL